MIKTVLGSIISSIAVLIGVYFRGKSVAKEEVRVNNLENVIKNQNEIKKIKKRVAKNDTLNDDELDRQLSEFSRD
jgi:uncharacterized membrane protein YvbJ